MTDEKKELPWRNTGKRCDACLGFEPACRNCPTCKGTGYQGEICFLVPEPEAKELWDMKQKIDVERLNTSSIVHSLLIAEIRALQERVKKFEEGCKCLLVGLRGAEITFKQDNGSALSEGIDLLRGAMGGIDNVDLPMLPGNS